MRREKLGRKERWSGTRFEREAWRESLKETLDQLGELGKREENRMLFKGHGKRCQAQGNL